MSKPSETISKPPILFFFFSSSFFSETLALADNDLLTVEDSFALRTST